MSSIKQTIANFILKVKVVQRSWMNHLRRQRARMALLSRQWDRAVIFLRSKGKVWKLSSYYLYHSHPFLNSNQELAAANDGSKFESNDTKSSGKQVRLNGSQRMKKPAVDATIALHNTILIKMDQRQISLLGRISKYPNVKWQVLYAEFRRKQNDHIRALKESEEAVRDYQDGLEQKQLLESVLRSFTETEARNDGASELLPPAGLPRFNPCLHPSVIQESICQVISLAAHSSC
eukprot:768537-Hanusia_phi.AAC.2